MYAGHSRPPGRTGSVPLCSRVGGTNMRALFVGVVYSSGSWMWHLRYSASQTLMFSLRTRFSTVSGIWPQRTESWSLGNDLPASLAFRSSVTVSRCRAEGT